MSRRPPASRPSTRPRAEPAPPGAPTLPARKAEPRSSEAPELLGKRAVVTGASSGIGRAIALELAGGGADVLVSARRSRKGAEETAGRILGMGRAAPVVMADLGTAEGCRELVEEAWRRLGGIDIWVNNAGTDILTGEGAKLDYEEKLDRLLAVDLLATVRLSREAGRRMKAEGGGSIINMGWDGARGGMAGESGELFSAAKGGVMAFTASLALSLAPEVRVNCLAPGWIRTAWGARASEKWQERVRRETPLGRWGTPEDVARVARFLASPAAGHLTAQVIAVNGGAVRF